MAACLITVSGTSGIIRINYTLSGIPYYIDTSIGSFYIDDTSTDVTYTTLTGDLIAADSGCLTPSIVELPANYYEISWLNVIDSGYNTIDKLFLGYEGEGEITLSDITFPNSKKYLGQSINQAGDNRVKTVAYKSIISEDSSTVGYSYILKVLGTERPDIRVRNLDDTSYIYIHGVSTSSTIPSGYTLLSECYSQNIIPEAP